MTRPRGAVLEATRSPLICGGGPDSERRGRQHHPAPATLSGVTAGKNSTLLLLFGSLSPNRPSAGFAERQHNEMLFIQSVIAARRSCQNPHREFPHWACSHEAQRSNGHTSTQRAQVQSSLARVGFKTVFFCVLLNMSPERTGHITTQTG